MPERTVIYDLFLCDGFPCRCVHEPLSLHTPPRILSCNVNTVLYVGVDHGSSDSRSHEVVILCYLRILATIIPRWQGLGRIGIDSVNARGPLKSFTVPQGDMLLQGGDAQRNSTSLSAMPAAKHICTSMVLWLCSACDRSVTTNHSVSDSLRSDIDTALMPMALASVSLFFCAVKPSLNHSLMSCAQCVRFSSGSNEHSCFVLASCHSCCLTTQPGMTSPPRRAECVFSPMI